MQAHADRTAIASPEHLKQWLIESGRPFVVLQTVDLVDALSWPAGVETFMAVVDAYRRHRGMIPTGASAADDATPPTKSEALTDEELLQCLDWLRLEAGQRGLVARDTENERLRKALTWAEEASSDPGTETVSIRWLRDAMKNWPGACGA